MRFRCILKERTARYKPHVVGKFVMVSAALHNLCLQEGINMDEIEIIQEIGAPDYREFINDEENGRERNEIVRRYFT